MKQYTLQLIPHSLSRLTKGLADFKKSFRPLSKLMPCDVIWLYNSWLNADISKMEYLRRYKPLNQCI